MPFNMLSDVSNILKQYPSVNYDVIINEEHHFSIWWSLPNSTSLLVPNGQFSFMNGKYHLGAYGVVIADKQTALEAFNNLLSLVVVYGE